MLNEELDPDEITRVLELRPTNTIRAGDRISERSARTRRYSGWFLESINQVDSRDSRDHIDWLLHRGYLVDIRRRWDSAAGHGGPSFTPWQLSTLGASGIEVWFDIYFDSEETAEDSAMQQCDS